MDKLHLTDYDYWQFIYYPAMQILALMRIYEMLEDLDIEPEGQAILNRVILRIKENRNFVKI